MRNDRGGNRSQGGQDQKPKDPKLVLSVDSRKGRDAIRIQVRFKRNTTVILRLGTADMPFDQKLRATIVTGDDGIGDCKLDLSGFDDHYDRLTAFVGDIASNTVVLPGPLAEVLTSAKSSTSHLKVMPETEVVVSHDETFSVSIRTFVKGKPASRRFRVKISKPAKFTDNATGVVLVENALSFLVDSNSNGCLTLLIHSKWLEVYLWIEDLESGEMIEKTLRFI